MRDEVLKDHLLDVAVLGVDGRDRFKRGDSILGALTDPDEDPGREWDPELSGESDRLEASGRVLRRGALVDDQARVRRLKHQALRGGHLPEAEKVLAGQHPEIGMREHAPLDRALARPDHIRGEVLMSPVPESLGDDRVDLGPLPGEDQELFAVPPDRLIEPALDLTGVVDVRLVCREGAVLAVALARSRQRKGVVARERDPAHRRANLAKWGCRPV
jgi:hypothetical protein